MLGTLVVIHAILDVLSAGLIIIGTLISLKIAIFFNLDKNNEAQFRLEKLSHLFSTLIFFVLILRIIMFLFFIFTIDDLSDIIIGAMCAVGVIDAMELGNFLVIFKLVVVYLGFFWILFYQYTQRQKTIVFMRTRAWLFLPIGVLALIEIALDLYTFFMLDPSYIASCCGILYTSGADSLIAIALSLPLWVSPTIFYLNIILMLIFRNKYAFAVLSFLLIFTALTSLIAFFGTYIYELPTHHCPFCILQKEYYYIGYILYALLFLASSFGMASFFKPMYKKRAIFFALLYAFLASFYVVRYVLISGVWL